MKLNLSAPLFAAVTLLATAVFSATAGPAATTVVAPPGTVGQSLFNGKNLEGWSGLRDHWKIDGDTLMGYTTAWAPLKNNTFLVWTNGTVGDFELHLKYKIIGGNSGVQYRSELKDPAAFIVGGYQADIDASPRYTGILYEERGRGILADRGQQTVVKDAGGKPQVKVASTIGTPEQLQKFIHQEEWNDYVIVAQGNSVMHFINGHLMSSCLDMDSSKAPTQGILALQIHVGPPMQVMFKDIVLYPLGTKP